MSARMSGLLLSRETVHSAFEPRDIATEERWQRWAALSAPLVAGGDAHGALKVYGRDRCSFGDRGEYLLTMFAAQAGILVANVRSFDDARKLSDALVDQLRGRDVISMAEGIVMAREHVDDGTAFAASGRDQACRPR